MRVRKIIASWLRYLADRLDPSTYNTNDTGSTIDWGPDACPHCTPKKRCERHKSWNQHTYKFLDPTTSCEDCKAIRKKDPTKSCPNHTITTIGSTD